MHWSSPQLHAGTPKITLLSSNVRETCRFESYCLTLLSLLAGDNVTLILEVGLTTVGSVWPVETMRSASALAGFDVGCSGDIDEERGGQIEFSAK